MELSENIIKCLSEKMSLDIEHFYKKINSLSVCERVTAVKHISVLFQCANDVKGESKTYADYDKLFFQSGSFGLNELLQSVFDCFRGFIECDGVELIKELYTHTNRGGENWFPVSVINSPLGDYHHLGEDIAIYRGCNRDEFDNTLFRQSWTTDIDIARDYAYVKFPGPNRVVIKSVIKTTDIFLSLVFDSEIVINLDAELMDVTIVKTEYDGPLCL